MLSARSLKQFEGGIHTQCHCKISCQESLRPGFKLGGTSKAARVPAVNLQHRGSMSLLVRILHTVQALGALVYHVATLRFRPFHHLHERVGAVVAAAAAPQPQPPTATTDRVRVLTHWQVRHWQLGLKFVCGDGVPMWGPSAR